jgi:uncharacterized membrane protein
MKAPSTRPLRTDRWLVAIWLALILFGPLTIVIFFAGLPLLYQQLSTICPDVCQDNRLSAAAAATWQESGLSMELYAAIDTGLALLLALVSFGTAGLLLLRRPRERMPVFVALMLIFLGGTFSSAFGMVGQRYPDLNGLISFINLAGFGLFPILFLAFPDGRFVPGWSRWLALALFAVAVSGLVPVAQSLPSGGPFIALLVFWALIGPLAQAYRYRRVSAVVEKQQTKWLVAGLSLGIGGFLVTGVIAILSGVPDTAGPFALVVTDILVYLFMAVIPVTIATGVLRYRLWDVDVIVRRTLVYAVLTGLLALIYFGTVIALQVVFESASGQQSPVSIVISTLVIAALFSPLRRRVQSVIDRRFFRQKYDADQVLAHFAEHARDEVEVEALTAELLAAIQETVRPECAGIWLRTQARPDRREVEQ